MDITKIKKQKDGSAIVTYTLTSLERQMFRDVAKKKEVPLTDEFINEEILKAIESGIREDKKLLKSDKRKNKKEKRND